MSKFDKIRPYNDDEVNEVLQVVGRHPMIKSMLQFIFPQATDDYIKGVLRNCHSIRDFQTKVIARGIQNVLTRSSEGLTTSGFNRLDKNTSYLFISNHRDIVLDTGLINLSLFHNDMVMTSSAIGDNLVKQSFLLALSKLNRSFLVQRALSPREMLMSSKLLSELISTYIQDDNRSVWMAQREGRTKNGDDVTQQGLLKMLSLGKGTESDFDHFKNLKIVPVAISYEFDPTDMLKIPELLANHYEEEYIKSENEDFNSILKGLSGYKKRIHIGVGDVLSLDLDAIDKSGDPKNKKFQELGLLIDRKIHQLYKLWPTNYLAYDLLFETKKYSSFYTDKEERQFHRRIERRVDVQNKLSIKNFLSMYANPVVNKEKIENA